MMVCYFVDVLKDMRVTLLIINLHVVFGHAVMNYD